MEDLIIQAYKTGLGFINRGPLKTGIFRGFYVPGNYIRPLKQITIKDFIQLIIMKDHAN